MKVTQEKLPASQIGLQIEVTPEMSQQAYDKTLQEFTRSVNIPGFRKGKVPRQVLIQRFGSERIKAAVVEDLVQDSLKKAIEQEKIEALGNFELKSSFEELVAQYQPGAALTFSAAVDVPPTVTLKDYTGLTVQAEEIKYDPERVNNTLEDYRKKSATLVPVEDRPAEKGDVATVDFKGIIADTAEGEEPQEIPGGSAEDFEIELLEGRFIEGFIDGMIGMKPGETKDVTAQFPEGYPQADLAGKPAIFTVTVKELKARELPELDDDFAQEVSEFETLEELRQSLENRFQEEADRKTKDNKQEALLNELVNHIEVELPETLIKREVDYSITQTAMQMSQQGMDVRKMFTQEIVDMLRQQARPEATKRLMRTLTLGEVAKTQSIKVEPPEVDAKVAELIKDQSTEGIDMQRLREVVEEDLLKDKILDWLEQNNTVELVPEGTLKQDEAETDIPEEAGEVAALDEAIEVEASAVESDGEADAAESDAPEAEPKKSKSGKSKK
ncbi:trigger factor [Leptolyngbya ohadii]|uniref:trigger factor n=1 Tax=Leptolyngbya ohadii TaxID=1962290 RepID=UPI000B599D99|nr:trigger factor [Leptolyngbya ohadii]